MKALTERIAERQRSAAPSSAGANRAVMLALRDDIQQALDDGWSVLAIYQTLHDEGQLTFSYQAFRRHVNRHLLGKPPEQPKQRVASSAAEKQHTAPHKFTFNPSPNPRDLL
ncbi:TraK family protein [Kerstersia gyiorum]|nr:TraK family protein [Kerstersia gyiorum]